MPADKLYVGVRTKDVKPTGATTSYAAPELLRSLQRQWEGAEDDEEFVMINGPAADIWSFACVCYEMLTGDLPFLPDQTPATCAPAVVVEEVQPTWEEYETIIKCHKLWVSLSLIRLVLLFQISGHAVFKCLVLQTSGTDAPAILLFLNTCTKAFTGYVSTCKCLHCWCVCLIGKL